MAFRDDVTVDWAVSPRIIEVSKDGASPTSITIQDLVDTCRTLESALGAMDDDYLINAAGKEDLGGGQNVGITLSLNNARVKFEDRPSPTWITCNVSGGNLVAVDSLGDSMNPIEPSSYVTVFITQSSSAVMLQADEINTINTNTAAIKTKTDNLPSDPTSTTELASAHGDGSWVSPTAQENAEAVQSALATNLSQLQEIFTLMGLDPSKPLLVTRTSRAAGSIFQVIEDSTNVRTRVTRTQ